MSKRQAITPFQEVYDRVVVLDESRGLAGHHDRITHYEPPLHPLWDEMSAFSTIPDRAYIEGDRPVWGSRHVIPARLAVWLQLADGPWVPDDHRGGYRASVPTATGETIQRFYPPEMVHQSRQRRDGLTRCFASLAIYQVANGINTAGHDETIRFIEQANEAGQHAYWTPERIAQEAALARQATEALHAAGLRHPGELRGNPQAIMEIFRSIRPDLFPLDSSD